MNPQSEWYVSLLKPEWAPPAFVFGPVWFVLYVLIAISFGQVARMFFSGKIRFAVFLPFILNLVFNFAFSPLQFGLQDNLLASIDTVLLFLSLIWAMVVIWPHARWVTYINIPYLLWSGFAMILQLTVTVMNWG